MRLIDADEITKQFDPNTWQGEMMIAIANGLPTTYDVDKVVEQLEQAKHSICLYDDYLEWYQSALSDAISIVKVGGKDEL